ncbi:hypothetical protein E2P81_ATG08177 [Venturia nashicola]|nr:hypothetical protein E2P81_ATG08177 [Venturia nashicola]
MPSLLKIERIFSIFSTIILSTNAATSRDYILAPGKTGDYDFTCGGSVTGLKAQYNHDQHLALVVKLCQDLQVDVQHNGNAEKRWDFYAEKDGMKVVGLYSVHSFADRTNCPTPVVLDVAECSSWFQTFYESCPVSITADRDGGKAMVKKHCLTYNINFYTEKGALGEVPLQPQSGNGYLVPGVVANGASLRI